MRGAQILDAVRLHKNGFPESMNYSEFWRKFRTLGDENAMKIQPTLSEMKEAVASLLEYIDLDKSTARLGNTQVITVAKVQRLAAKKKPFCARGNLLENVGLSQIKFLRLLGRSCLILVPIYLGKTSR